MIVNQQSHVNVIDAESLSITKVSLIVVCLMKDIDAQDMSLIRPN